eukprot:7605128-Lingulodinium_polyedra.AAC.1
MDVCARAFAFALMHGGVTLSTGSSSGLANAAINRPRASVILWQSQVRHYMGVRKAGPKAVIVADWSAGVKD